MGEKGNITYDELAAAAQATAAGAVVAGAGTYVTAVFHETGETLKDKIIDKGTDAGIASAQEAWRGRRRGAEAAESAEAADAAPEQGDPG